MKPAKRFFMWLISERGEKVKLSSVQLHTYLSYGRESQKSWWEKGKKNSKESFCVICDDHPSSSYSQKVGVQALLSFHQYIFIV